MGDGGCEGRLQQRVGLGSVRRGSGVLQKGVVPVVDTVFRPWQFDVEWDGKVRGKRSANVGVPQGSLLSLVV